LGKEKAGGKHLTSPEQKIEEYYNSRIAKMVEAQKLQRDMKKNVEEVPFVGQLLEIFELVFEEFENQYKIHRLLNRELISTRKTEHIFNDWINYFKEELNHLSSSVPSDSPHGKEAKKKLEILEKKQQEWEKEYKPIFEHLKTWINGMEEREKRSKQFKGII